MTRAASENVRRQAIVDWVNEYLERHPCVWCGESNPIVLEFDHLDHAEKSWAIGRAIANVPSIARLEKEVAKTQVLCANCHRVKTARERGSHRWRKYGGGQRQLKSGKALLLARR